MAPDERRNSVDVLVEWIEKHTAAVQKEVERLHATVDILIKDCAATKDEVEKQINKICSNHTDVRYQCNSLFAHEQSKHRFNTTHLAQIIVGILVLFDLIMRIFGR